MVSPISIRLDERVNEILSEYVNSKNISKAEFIRTAIVEKLEDDIDVELADKVYKEWNDNGRKTISLDEMMEKYGEV